MAHLIPLSYERASAYSDVARCVLGLGDNARITIQQTIHGTQRVLGQTRVPDTGIKYSLLNQIRLPGQAVFFDQQPCVVIVPILTWDQVKAWNLEEYDAIVLAGAYKTTTAAQAYGGIQMPEPRRGTLATIDEIKTACQLLSQTVQGLAFSLVHRRRQRHQKSLKPAMRRLLQSVRENLEKKGEIIVPMASREGEVDMRVGKVSFQAHAACAHADLAHVAPDPALLVMKAAINWTWRNDQQLLVTGERTEEDDDEDTLSD
jgi:hypothetical protein